MSSVTTVPELEDSSLATTKASLVGRVLGGRYRVTALLGAGGMGEVYAVEHTQLGCRMALKCLASGAAARPAGMRRFEQEAWVGATLRHPSLVRVFDLQTSGETPFMVMELLEGIDLRSLLEREPNLSLARSVTLLCDALEGLAEAHAQGIVHRDFKPSNLFVVSLAGQEHCKLLDFGVAKIPQRPTSTLEVKTNSGQPLGTFAYMAPEQIRGARDVDARADVYSAAAVFFEMLSGRRHFEADSAPEQIFKVLHERCPRLDDLVPACPKALADLIERALSTERERRPKDAATLLEELRRLTMTTPPPQSAPGIPASTRGAMLMALAGCAVGIVLGWGAQRMTHEATRESGTEPARATAVALAPSRPAVATAVSMELPEKPLPMVNPSPSVLVSSSAPKLLRNAKPVQMKLADHQPASPQKLDVERSNPYE